MDYRAVLVLLCVLIARASCVPVGDGKQARALNATIRLMRTEIQTALGKLATIGPIPNISCLSPNIMELASQKQHLLTADNLSTFRCYMMEMSELTPVVSSELQITSQYIRQVERLISGSTTRRDCRQPTDRQDADNYVFVRCLLELLDQRLSEA